MGFFAPWFLAGAAAVALPFYLHLLRRHTTNPQPFSSLMFFERRTQSSIRHRRLRYLLLLSLRTALLILLALAFANPFIQRTAAKAGGERLLLLVIDNSFSMRAGTRLADARREALSVLASRRPSDRAEVMALGSQLQVLAQPTQDPATLRAAVENVKPGDSRASYGELARALRSLSGTIATPIELHLFSDMQKSSMPANFADLALPPGTSLVLHPMAKSAVPNWTVESVNAPAQVWDPKKARVQVVVAGFGTEAAARTVSLVVNGKTIATRTAEVPAGGRASVDFQSLDVPYGFSRCEVRIDSADSFPADDVRWFAVERSDPRRALFIHESSDSRSLLYFQAALSAASEAAFDLDSATVGQGENLALSKYAFVVVSDVLSLPSSFENELARYVRSGGSVWIAAGTSTARAARIPVFGGKVLEPLYYSNRGERFLTVGDADPSYPSLQKSDRWSGVKFYFALRVDPADARVAARLTDQTPLLLEKKIGEGTVLLFTSGFDNLTNDFPLHPIFVPFVEQTAWYLSGLARRGGSRLVDSFLELRNSKEQAVSVEVVDPDGRRPLSLKEAATAQNYQLTRAGFYELQLANGRHDVVGVNADPRESNLDVISDETLALWRGNPTAGGSQAAAGKPGQQETRPYNVWWYVMVLVLAAALAESLEANQYLRTPREEP
jgi:Aerotolerance regulator N-terminal/von Willebrand factor type A domain